MPTEPSQVLKARFGFSFPRGLFDFWKFAQQFSAEGLSLDGSPLFIRLANLFQVFTEAQAGPDAESLETRFYKDPPEFVTALLGDTDGLHWGYYVDDPSEGPSCVAHYYHNDAFEFMVAGGLLDAVHEHALAVRHDQDDYLESDSGSADFYRENIKRLDTILGRLTPLAMEEPVRRQPTAPTRDGMGIVVPPDRYVPLANRDLFLESGYTPDESEVRRLREAAVKASRSGYSGTALKLGKDLWDYPEYFEISCELLDLAYRDLGRQLLSDRLRQIKQFRKDMDARRAKGST